MCVSADAPVEVGWNPALAVPREDVVKMLFKDWFRWLLPALVAVIGAIYLVRHRPFSFLESFGFAALCLAAGVTAWAKSRIVSEIFQCLTWGVVFLLSLRNDSSGGFFPAMWGVMFVFSLFTLRQAFQERRGNYY
jgi:hypothetical protein